MGQKAKMFQESTPIITQFIRTESSNELSKNQNSNKDLTNTSINDETLSKTLTPLADTSTPRLKRKYEKKHIKEYKCSECNFISNSKVTLNKHIIECAPKPFVCNHCEKNFSDIFQLNNHLNIHLGYKPHACDQCDQTFTTRGELTRHVRYKHTLEKPHKCTECEYSTVELSKLKRHMRVHTGERPYMCEFCNYTSSDTFRLKRHLRIHTGEKPYECPSCSASFNQSNSLKYHINKRCSKKKKTELNSILEMSTSEINISVSNQNENNQEMQNPFYQTNTSTPAETEKKTIKHALENLDETLIPNIQEKNKSLEEKESKECFDANQKDNVIEINNWQTSGENWPSSKTPIPSPLFSSSVVKQSKLEWFKCEDCNSRFLTKDLFEEHRVIHTGERPFKCNICSVGFSHKFAMRQHILSHDEVYNQTLKAKLANSVKMHLKSASSETNTSL